VSVIWICNETSSSGIILYTKRVGVVHPCVRERKGKRHSLFRKLPIICTSLLATNVVQWHAGLANNASTTVESVQQWSFEVSLAYWEEWLWPSRTKGEPHTTPAWEGTPF